MFYPENLAHKGLWIAQWPFFLQWIESFIWFHMARWSALLTEGFMLWQKQEIDWWAKWSGKKEVKLAV